MGTQMKRWMAGLSLCIVVRIACAAPGPAPGGVDMPVSLGVGATAIQGSLRMPTGPGKPAIVLLIAGSGPTDRDGNSLGLTGHNDSLKLLADALAGAGFASVRYDKRGIGASAGAMTRETDLRFETFVQDAAGWAAQLAADPRFSGVAIVGHSEGSLIGMLAARQGKVAAFASIAGPGTSASKLLRVQLAGKLPPELIERNEQTLRTLEAGTLVDDVPKALAALYRPSVQPYLISWFKYQPAAEIGKLTMPVAIFQGDNDFQVSVGDAELLERGKPDAELHVIAGMNHVLKMVAADRSRQIASYGDPSLPVSPELVGQLVTFLQRATSAR